ncbi:ABC transporter ATP-binding protein [Pseudonocardia acaciae]|uniref:ABC transporter ATP-binding protein n=1 Tax=Pseudonocardia acaciae TaxID=551276 RepID=UPI000567D6AC|nr:ABC transporter ATP-binding protein [Pseudonocardia acaciae]
MSTPLIEARGVSKTFAGGGGEPLKAVDEVDFEVRAGELVALLGPSGCGKTTLMRVLAGLEPLTTGEIRIDGAPASGPRPDFGMVFQSPTLMPWRSVFDNVMYPMEVLRRHRSAAARARVRALLESVGLGGFERHLPAQLSGGMQQRVALCRALVHEPALLLMDEPFGALDELTRLQLNDLLLELRRASGTTIVFVTHSIPEAVYLSDRVLVFSARPCHIDREIAVDIAYPRSLGVRHTAVFNDLEREAERALGLERA